MAPTTDNATFRKLRVLLVASALIVGSILLLAYVAQTWSGLKRTEEDVGRNLQALALALSEQAESTFRASLLVLRSIQREIHDRGGRENLSDRELHVLFRDHLAGLPPAQGGLSAYAISIVDPAGQAYANSVEFPTPRVDAADRDYFRHHLLASADGIYLSALTKSRVTGLWVIFLSTRLEDPAGRFDGVMTISLQVSQFEAFYRRLNMPEGSAITLQRSDGRSLYRYPFRESFAEVDTSRNPLFQEMLRLKSGHLFVPVSPFDAEPRLVGFHVGSQFPLIAVVSIKRSIALAPWTHSVMVFSVLGLAALAVVAALSVFSLRQLQRLELATSASLHDPLTGLPNRRHCRERLSAEWRRMAREGKPLSVLFVDIDHFKRYNDHYGHAQGDTCLRQIAALLDAQIKREGDMVARYGGEEFVCVLPDTDGSGATAMADVFVKVAAAAQIPHSDSPIGPHVTLSVGCATTIPDLARDADSLLDLADRALYGAKRGGRNRIVASTDTAAV